MTQTAQTTWLDRVVEVVCVAVLAAATAAIFVILCANTILRYLTGSSLSWGNEVPELLFPWLVMAGIVLAARRGAHIATDFMVLILPARALRAVRVVVWLAVAGLHLTLAVATLQLLPIVHDERSPILRVPGSWTYGCVMVGLSLLAVLALQSAWQSFGTSARTNPQHAQEAS
ncbi:C4-dicarboxylate ABC transporter permease [Tepidimonas fonticaldi]|uniref:TRAP transporter small permease protein n=1 Tax=Tepidimonas fonticaldi TaxID=1101373 RepID=A0A1A6DTF3_9BURK|nr:TRAP transporter small permease [Tepidimonas fonticaldi]OBS29961.1 C4-dicarboxylate ABC transporter permease [Tepidimonas fonticaldi]